MKELIREMKIMLLSVVMCVIIVVFFNGFTYLTGLPDGSVTTLIVGFLLSVTASQWIRKAIEE